ncbi:chaperone modulator CbpM [Weeksellaceae bacterium KMM 9713]|uniref:Chaperone modulator CbpM n=1 Tax=Profundicola chukchiensis TaxID=2961959 RepID=A0A9X4MZY9_9FLAO|nr:chaperone modulator CbpM [Profundicola chukchiensis]MDG4946840.1 chaperone modulator CbpM [Profundicola chukchiensis]
METRYIKITEFCENEKIETSFLLELNREGLLRLEKQEEVEYIDQNDLPQIEMFARWHYELGVNLEGIDAMRHMLERMKEMQRQIQILEKKLQL